MILQSLCAYAASFFCAYLYLQNRGALSQDMPQTRRDERSYSYIREFVDQDENSLQEPVKGRDCQYSVSNACARAEHAREGASSSELATKDAPVRLFWDHDNIPVTQTSFDSIIERVAGGPRAMVRMLKRTSSLNQFELCVTCFCNPNFR